MDNGASSYRRFLEGDESAFDAIMKELFDSLVFFIDRYVHDIHAAEDIAIDAFSDLVVNKHRYNFDMNPKVWTKLNIKLFERMSSVLNRAHSF